MVCGAVCRDPDPLESIGSPASSAQAEPGSSDTPDAHASAAAGSPGDVGFSPDNSGNGNDLAAASAGVTPERSSKRQRRSPSSLKVEAGGGGGGVSSSAAGSSAAINLLPPPPPGGVNASPAPAAGDPTAGGVASTSSASSAAAAAPGGKDDTTAGGKADPAHAPSDAFHKDASFQADAPLPEGMSISSIVEEAEVARCGVAAAGGNEGSGEIWGGGALSRKLSEQATQVRL